MKNHINSSSSNNYYLTSKTNEKKLTPHQNCIKKISSSPTGPTKYSYIQNTNTIVLEIGRLRMEIKNIAKNGFFAQLDQVAQNRVAKTRLYYYHRISV